MHPSHCHSADALLFVQDRFKTVATRVVVASQHYTENARRKCISRQDAELGLKMNGIHVYGGDCL